MKWLASILRSSVGALVLLLLPSTAAAFENQWHLGGGLGAVNASSSDLGLGAGANAFASYGLSDMFDLKLDMAASSHTLTVAGNQERHAVYSASLGVAYKLDVIEWIPYFGLHAGYLLSDLPGDSGIRTSDALLGGMLGLDYAVSREFGVGVMNRLHFAAHGGSLVDLFLRAEYRWGF